MTPPVLASVHLSLVLTSHGSKDTLLHMAARGGHASMVQALIALNADVQAANNEYEQLRCSCIDLDDCEVDSRDHL